MADQPSPRRRFQFRLRTLMIAVTLLAIPCGYLGWQAKIVRDRRAMIDRVVSIDNGFRMKIDFRMTEPAVSVPWIRRLLGDEAIDYIDLPLDTEIEERQRIRAAFPEAHIVGVYPRISGGKESPARIAYFPDDRNGDGSEAH
jgi:hypothetical protein